MDLHESGENYLETILMLQQQNGSVRSIDIANQLEFSRASVSRAMSILKKNGYIDISVDGKIILTYIGLKKAESVYERHQLISNFLIKLGVSEDVAKHDACKIEHVISEETFDIIKSRYENFNKNLSNQ